MYKKIDNKQSTVSSNISLQLKKGGLFLKFFNIYFCPENNGAILISRNSEVRYGMYYYYMGLEK